MTEDGKVENSKLINVLFSFSVEKKKSAKIFRDFFNFLSAKNEAITQTKISNHWSIDV